MPRVMRRRLLLPGVLGGLGALVLAFALAASSRQDEQLDPGNAIGLFSSLPILWPESPDLAGLLATGAPAHWALAVLRERGRVVALDALLDDAKSQGLPGLRLLVMAQPRPLSPQENVALDGWVRRGGRLLLFADPMLTHDSAFAMGDSRRPQDIVMISPLLAHWGLILEFDDMQPVGAKMAQAFGARLPVALPGRFIAAGKNGDCVPRDQGLAAMCRIGAGRVIAIADAAMLEGVDPGGVAARRDALLRLISALESAD